LLYSEFHEHFKENFHSTVAVTLPVS